LLQEHTNSLYGWEEKTTPLLESQGCSAVAPLVWYSNLLTTTSFVFAVRVRKNFKKTQKGQQPCTLGIDNHPSNGKPTLNS